METVFFAIRLLILLLKMIAKIHLSLPTFKVKQELKFDEDMAYL